MRCSKDGKLRMYCSCEISETVMEGMEFAIRLIDPDEPLRALETLEGLGIVEQTEIEGLLHWRFTDEGYTRFTPVVSHPHDVVELDRDEDDTFRLYMCGRYEKPDIRYLGCEPEPYKWKNEKLSAYIAKNKRLAAALAKNKRRAVALARSEG